MQVLAVAAAVLSITATPADGPARHWTLRCAPAGGTLPHAAAACTRLAAIPRPFAPIRPGTMCSQIYGGPEVAVVTGRYRGKNVFAVFRRRNGCETDRWNAYRFLFPIPLSSSA